MPDHLDDLKTLRVPADHRLPPSAVRRRGDRMRRRRTLLQLGGVAAAVALVLGGGTMLAEEGPQTSPRPLPPASQAPSPAIEQEEPPEGGWVTTVPGDLRGALIESLPAEAEGARPESRPGRAEPWVALPCGRETDTGDPVFPGSRFPADEQRTDQHLVTLTPPAAMEARQLLVYQDAAAADAALDAARAQAEGCGPVEAIPDLSEFRWEVRPMSFGDHEGLLLAGGEFAAGTDERAPSRQLVALVRRGNAVLSVVLADESSAALDDLRDPDAVRLVEVAAGLADRMCLFTAEGCGGTTAPGPDAAGAQRFSSTSRIS